MLVVDDMTGVGVAELLIVDIRLSTLMAVANAWTFNLGFSGRRENDTRGGSGQECCSWPMKLALAVMRSILCAKIVANLKEWSELAVVLRMVIVYVFET